ncbi:LamG domain-containing protein, partial [Microbulbifer thermotolerans]
MRHLLFVFFSVVFLFSEKLYSAEYKDVVLSDGAIAYWDMEEINNGVISDQSGNGYDLVSISNPLLIDTGLNIGKAVSLDGVSQYLSSVDTNFPELQTQFTIEVWAKFENLSGWRTLIGRNAIESGQGVFFFQKAAYNQNHDIGHKTAGHVAFGFDSDGTTVSVEDLTPVSAGQWNYFAVTYDGKYLSFYKNGKLTQSEAFSGGFRKSDGPLIVGGASLQGTVIDYVEGQIADVAFYNSALSSDKLRSHYVTGANLVDVDEVVIASDFYVSSEDNIIDGKKIIVDGATLTIDGSHNFNSITLQNGAVLTHSLSSNLLELVVADSVNIDSSSKIDLSGKGSGSQGAENPCSGGSYGGIGGGVPGTGTTNVPFGDYQQPFELGLGGYACEDSLENSQGGGAIKLVVNNRLEIYGKILANGSFSDYVGGGSGGSIWIEAKELIGGSDTWIEASGGLGYNAASGGGGRIAIYYDSLTGFDPADRVFARAGYNYYGATAYGGPGTVYLYDRSVQSNNAKLQIINHNVSTLYAPYRFSGEIDASIFIRNARAIIEDETYINAAISGSGYNSAYVSAEGAFFVANNNLVVDGYTLELSQDYSFDSITVKNSGKITTPVASDTFTSGITLSATDFYISSNSYIDVSAKGHLPEEGEHWKSGGSYGGPGGAD